MRVLGISCFYHDGAAALVEDGKIIAAAQEERFTRKKFDATFPKNSIAYCLKNISPKSIDLVAFYDKPFLKFERLLETYLSFAPRGFTSFSQALPAWLGSKLFQKNQLLRELKNHLGENDWENKLLFSEHHLSHAASAFYPSPFEEALVLTMDGVGEWTTTSALYGKGAELNILKEIHFPHSIGLLYSAFTYFLGFQVNSDEYKIMGLAAYGTPKFTKLIFDNLIDVKADGSFRLNLKYFDYCTGLTMTNSTFNQLFGLEPRRNNQPITQTHKDIAASIQQVTEEIMLRLTRSLAQETGLQNLCLAGGVALNSIANGKIVQDGRFKHVWIQPAAGDAGGALGAALFAYYQHHPRKNNLDQMQGAYLGPEFSQKEIEATLKKSGANFEILLQPDLLKSTAKELAAGKVVAWFQGRMEFGPRALGNRSILADPRSAHMQATLNSKIKFRESFRPFAPAVLKEKALDWFDLKASSPYMSLVASVLQPQKIPAVTHVDGSARVQTVDKTTNPLFYDLIASFEEETGVPILVNTSFNLNGEPIVCTPSDAYRTFMNCQIDLLVVGNCVLSKEAQDAALWRSYDKMSADG